MPAKEYVEPVGLLQKRGERGGSAGTQPPNPIRLLPRPRPKLPRRPSRPSQPRRRHLLLRRKPRQPRQKNPPTRRLPRSAARADPTIQRSAPACRPAAHRRCNAWIKTRRRYRPAASRPSAPPVVARRLRRREVRPAALRLPVRPQHRLPWRQPSSCCGRCGRARNYSCSARRAAATFARCAEGSRPAAAVSCSAWLPTQARCQLSARMC